MYWSISMVILVVPRTLTCGGLTELAKHQTIVRRVTATCLARGQPRGVVTRFVDAGTDADASQSEALASTRPAA